MQLLHYKARQFHYTTASTAFAYNLDYRVKYTWTLCICPSRIIMLLRHNWTNFNKANLTSSLRSKINWTGCQPKMKNHSYFASLSVDGVCCKRFSVMLDKISCWQNMIASRFLIASGKAEVKALEANAEAGKWGSEQLRCHEGAKDFK